MAVLSFSGHDTFHCRLFWLKKAYDYVAIGNSFTDDEASIHLGVGKNMVSAIRYWSKAFGLINDDGEPSELAQRLFSDSGWDPYLEDSGTLWLLHYELLRQNIAPTFSLIFNEVIKERVEFDTEYFLKFVNGRIEGNYNQNTLKKDFTVFTRTYFADFKAKDIEEGFTGLLTELNLLRKIDRSVVDINGKLKQKAVWQIEKANKRGIPLQILLYTVLSTHNGERSISFEQLYNDKNSVGSVFALSREGLAIELEKLAEHDRRVTFSNHAGIRELQIREEIEPLKVLEEYYG